MIAPHRVLGVGPGGKGLTLELQVSKVWLLRGRKYRHRTYFGLETAWFDGSQAVLKIVAQDFR